jgi:hypothetical protein
VHAKGVLVHYTCMLRVYLCIILINVSMYIVQTLYRTLYNDQFGIKGVVLNLFVYTIFLIIWST